jgi:hypothetical protein
MVQQTVSKSSTVAQASEVSASAPDENARPLKKSRSAESVNVIEDKENGSPANLVRLTNPTVELDTKKVPTEETKTEITAETDTNSQGEDVVESSAAAAAINSMDTSEEVSKVESVVGSASTAEESTSTAEESPSIAEESPSIAQESPSIAEESTKPEVAEDAVPAEEAK